jgi:hypothetical protein
MRTPLRLVLLAAAVVSVAADAWAQQRSGFVAGVSFGGGALGVTGTTVEPGLELARQDDTWVGVIGFDAHFGFMTGARTALMFVMTGDFEPEGSPSPPVLLRAGNAAVVIDEGTTAMGEGIFAAAVQQWITPRMWVRGGLGGGFLTRDFTSGGDFSYLTLTVDRGFGLAFLIALGREFYNRSSFAVDVEFHLTTVAVAGASVAAPSMHVGFNWY